jgi:hypothetical protein
VNLSASYARSDLAPKRAGLPATEQRVPSTESRLSKSLPFAGRCEDEKCPQMGENDREALQIAAAVHRRDRQRPNDQTRKLMIVATHQSPAGNYGSIKPAATALLTAAVRVEAPSLILALSI